MLLAMFHCVRQVFKERSLPPAVKIEYISDAGLIVMENLSE
jgi:hypothetical protein